MSNYQLILQLPANEGAHEFDRLVELEEALRNELEPRHQVDGHDLGSGTMNIFVLTDHPLQAFSTVKETAYPKELQGMRAAYRSVDGDEYTILWPERWSGPFTLA